MIVAIVSAGNGGTFYRTFFYGASFIVWCNAGRVDIDISCSGLIGSRDDTVRNLALADGAKIISGDSSGIARSRSIIYCCFDGSLEGAAGDFGTSTNKPSNPACIKYPYKYFALHPQVFHFGRSGLVRHSNNAEQSGVSMCSLYIQAAHRISAAIEGAKELPPLRSGIISDWGPRMVRIGSQINILCEAEILALI